MQLRGKEIIVHHNETFTLDMVVTMRNNAPFILDENIANPYLLLSISSTNYKYNSDDRYLCNWWLSLADIPKFHSTIPVEIDEFTEENLVTDGENYVYVSTENGIRKYKYWKDNKFVDYEFRIVKYFGNDITKEWTENAYTYSITFIAGQNTYGYLQSIWKSEWGTIPATVEEAWEIAIANEPELINIIEQPTPICNYSDVLVFVEPSKLTVLSDIKGSL